MYRKVNEKEYLKINASEISSCIGCNKYESKDIIVLKIWRRIDNERFEKAMERNNIKLINIENINKNDKNNKKYIKKYEEMVNNFENGIFYESKAIEIYQAMKNVSVKDNNKKSYVLFINNNYGRLLYYTPRILGYIDGIVEDKNDKYIVEIKNRQNKIFDYIPDYELIQIIIYMKITGIYKCNHIEKFKKEIRIKTIHFDEKKWNKIEEDIVKFIDYFEKIYFNDIFQDLFFKNILQNIKLKDELSSNLGFILEKSLNND